MNLHDFRRQYQQGGLRRQTLHDDPITQFEQWFNELLEYDVPDPTAMILSTVDKNQQPSQRIVLLKKTDRSGFTFFTNRNSAKAKDIDQNPQVSLHFPWHFIERQVIVCGSVEQVSRQESEAYFHSRPKQSQWAAWASAQSEPLEGRQALMERYESVQSEYPETVPLPEFWGGYRVIPSSIEFWQGGENRLHDRFIYRAQSDGEELAWSIQRVAP